MYTNGLPLCMHVHNRNVWYLWKNKAPGLLEPDPLMAVNQPVGAGNIFWLLGKEHKFS